MKLLKEILEINMKFTLVALKINNSTLFKDNNKRQGSAIVKVRIEENIATYVETIKKQWVSVKRALEKILALKISADRYSIELKLILQIRFGFNAKQKE